MTRHIISTELPALSVRMMLCLLLIQAGIPTANATLPRKPAPSTGHDTSRPLVLSGDADFLVPLLALHREALSVSQIAMEQAAQPRIRDYAARAVKHHRGQIATLNSLVRKYAKDEEPDFHVGSMSMEMQTLPGTTVGERYLRIMIRLLSEKIELAEFADGTIKINRTKRIAARTIETGSGDLVKLSRWLEQMSP